MGKFDKFFLCLNKYTCCCFTNKYKFDPNKYTGHEHDYVIDSDIHKTTMKRVPYSNSQIPSTRHRKKKYKGYPSHNSYRQFESTWRT